MENNNFDSMLAGLAEEYRKAEPMDDFMPADGEYTVILSDLAKGVKVKEGELPLVWLSVKGKLLAAGDPEIDNKKMTIGFFSSKALGMLKGFVTNLLPANLTPESDAFIDVDDIGQCVAFIENKVNQGTILTIAVSTTPKGFRNVKVTGVVEEALGAPNEAAEAPAEAPADVPA